MFAILTAPQENALRFVADRLGVDRDALHRLMNFESGFNPQGKNPAKESTARGLLQFTDTAARNMGYSSAVDLVIQYPTIESQLLGPVLEYLMQYAPFRDEADLYLSVFYPAARMWPLDREFPAIVQAANQGIKTPADYIARVEGTVNTRLLMFAGIAAGGFLLLWFLMSKGG